VEDLQRQFGGGFAGGRFSGGGDRAGKKIHYYSIIKANLSFFIQSQLFHL
jgi:hypothetical protein